MPASQPAQSCLGLLAPADLIQHYCHCQLPCLARPWSEPRAPSSEVRHSDTDCCGPSLQATSSSTSCFFTFPHPLLADLGGWSNKAPKQPLPQVCRPSEPLICLHYWSLGCVSSHCLASLPHVRGPAHQCTQRKARQGKAASAACYSLMCCAHESYKCEAYRDETKERCTRCFSCPVWTIACSKIGLPCLHSQLSWAAAQIR